MEVPDEDGVDIRSFARSICTHCLPGPSSTHEPSLPSLSPSTIMSSVPTSGLLSLAVTFLFLARLMVPAGTIKIGALAFRRGLKIGHVERHRRAHKQRRRQLGLQNHLVLRKRGGCGQAVQPERQNSRKGFSSSSQALTSSAVMASLVCAATASLALWITYSLLNASSPGNSILPCRGWR
jgi:hypothetical protein